MDSTPQIDVDQLGLDPMNSFGNPKIKSNNFQSEALRLAIGEARAKEVLKSLSMGIIPDIKSKDSLSNAKEEITKAQSMQMFGKSISNQLLSLQKNLEKKMQKQTGISGYLVETNSDDDDGYDDEDDVNDDVFGKEGADGAGKGKLNASKLIDLELVRLIKFCNDLYVKYKHTDEYEEDLMMKALEIGKKTREKTLILDMDETMIGTKFEGKDTPNFTEDFQISFHGNKISVSLRPYLAETLEKLGQFYEIIAFTAGVQEYADQILDKIDPNKKIFKKRLYRDTCIKCDQFYIKDLDVIMDRQKENIIIVDNSIVSFACDLANGVPINSYMGNDQQDKDLLYLYSFLEQAFYDSDVRKSLDESFKLRYILASITGKTENQQS